MSFQRIFGSSLLLIATACGASTAASTDAGADAAATDAQGAADAGGCALTEGTSSGIHTSFVQVLE